MPRRNLSALVVVLTTLSILCACRTEQGSSKRSEDAVESLDAAHDPERLTEAVPKIAQVLTREPEGGIRVAFPSQGITLQEFSRQLRKESPFRLVIDPNADLSTRSLEMIGEAAISADKVTSFLQVLCFAHDLELKEVNPATRDKERIFLVTHYRSGCSLGRSR